MCIEHKVSDLNGLSHKLILIPIGQSSVLLLPSYSRWIIWSKQNFLIKHKAVQLLTSELSKSNLNTKYLHQALAAGIRLQPKSRSRLELVYFVRRKSLTYSGIPPNIKSKRCASIIQRNESLDTVFF